MTTVPTFPTFQDFLSKREQEWKTWYADIPMKDTYKTARPEIIMERMALDEDWDAFLILVLHLKDYRTSWYKMTLLEHYSNMGNQLPSIPDWIQQKLKKEE